MQNKKKTKNFFKKYLLKFIYVLTGCSLAFSIIPLIIKLNNNNQSLSNVSNNDLFSTKQSSKSIDDNAKTSDNKLDDQKGVATYASKETKQGSNILNTPSVLINYRDDPNYSIFEYRPVNIKPWKRLIGQRGVLNIQQTSNQNKIKFLYTPVGYNNATESAFFYKPFIFEYDFTNDIRKFSNILGTPSSNLFNEINFCGGIFNESLSQYVCIFSIKSNIQNNSYYYFPYVIDDLPQADVSTNPYTATTVHSLNYYLRYWWNNQMLPMIGHPTFGTINNGPESNYSANDIHKELKIIPYYEYNPNYHPNPSPGHGSYDLNNPNAPKPQNRPYESFLIVPANGDFTVSITNLFNHINTDNFGDNFGNDIATKITSFNIQKTTKPESVNPSSTNYNTGGVSSNGYEILQPIDLADNFVDANISNYLDAIISLRPMYLNPSQSSNNYDAQLVLISAPSSGISWGNRSNTSNQGFWYKFYSSTPNEKHKFLYDYKVIGYGNKNYSPTFPIFAFGKYGNSLINNFYIDIFNSYSSNFKTAIMTSYYFMPKESLGLVNIANTHSIFVNVPFGINWTNNSNPSLTGARTSDYTYNTQSDYDLDAENIYFDYLNNCVYAYQTYATRITDDHPQRNFTININWSYFMNFEMPSNLGNSYAPIGGYDYFPNNISCGIVNEKNPFAGSSLVDLNLPVPMSMVLRSNIDNKLHNSFLYYYVNKIDTNDTGQYLTIGSSNAILVKDNINDWGIAPDKSIRSITAEFLEKAFYSNQNYNDYFKTFNNYVGYDKYKSNQQFVQFPYNQHVTFEVLDNIDGDETSPYILRFKMKMKTDSKLVSIAGASSQNARIPENEFPILSNDFNKATAKERAPKPLYILNGLTGTEIFEIRGFQYETSGKTRVNKSGVYIGNNPAFNTYSPNEFKNLNPTERNQKLFNLFSEQIKKTIPIISSIGAIIEKHPNDWISFTDFVADDNNGVLYVRFKMPYTINEYDNIVNNTLFDTIALYGFKSGADTYSFFDSNPTTKYLNSELGVNLYYTPSGMVNIPTHITRTNINFPNTNKNGNTPKGNCVQVLSQYYLHTSGLRVALIYDENRPQDVIFRFYDDKKIINDQPRLVDYDNYEKEISYPIRIDYNKSWMTPGTKMFFNRMIPIQGSIDKFIIANIGDRRFLSNPGNDIISNWDYKLYYVDFSQLTPSYFDPNSKIINVDASQKNTIYANIFKRIQLGNSVRTNSTFLSCFSNFPLLENILSYYDQTSQKTYISFINWDHSIPPAVFSIDINNNRTLNLEVVNTGFSPWHAEQGGGTSHKWYASSSYNDRVWPHVYNFFPALKIGNSISALVTSYTNDKYYNYEVFQKSAPPSRLTSKDLLVSYYDLPNQNDFNIKKYWIDSYNYSTYYDSTSWNDSQYLQNTKLDEKLIGVNVISSNNQTISKRYYQQNYYAVNNMSQYINAVSLKANDWAYLQNIDVRSDSVSGEMYQFSKFNSDLSFHFDSFKTNLVNNEISPKKLNGLKYNQVFDWNEFLNYNSDSLKSEYLTNWLNKISYNQTNLSWTDTIDQKTASQPFDPLNTFKLVNILPLSINSSTVLNNKNFAFTNFSYDVNTKYINCNLTYSLGISDFNYLNYNLTSNGVNYNPNFVSLPIRIYTGDNSIVADQTTTSINYKNNFINQTQAYYFLNNATLNDFNQYFDVLNNGILSTDLNQPISNILTSIDYEIDNVTNQVNFNVVMNLQQAQINGIKYNNIPISFTFSTPFASLNDKEVFYYDLNNSGNNQFAQTTPSDFLKQNQDLNTQTALDLKSIINSSLYKDKQIQLCINKDNNIFTFDNYASYADDATGNLYVSFIINDPILGKENDYQSYQLVISGFKSIDVTSIIKVTNYKTDIAPSRLQSYLNSNIDQNSKGFVQVQNGLKNTQFVNAFVKEYDDAAGTATITFTIKNFITANGNSKPDELLSATFTYNNLNGTNSNNKTSIASRIQAPSNISTLYAQQLLNNDNSLINIISNNILFPTNDFNPTSDIHIMSKSFNNKKGELYVSFRLDNYLDSNEQVVKDKPIILHTTIYNFIRPAGPTEVNFSNVNDQNFDKLWEIINIPQPDYSQIINYVSITNPVVNPPNIKIAKIFGNKNKFTLQFEIDQYFENGQNGDLIIKQNGQFEVTVSNTNNIKSIYVSDIHTPKEINYENSYIDNESSDSFNWNILIISAISSIVIISIIVFMILIIKKRNKEKEN